MEEGKKVKPTRVLIASDSPRIYSGYGKVTNALAIGLAQRSYEVHVLGFWDRGCPVVVNGTYVLHGGRDNYGKEMLERKLKHLKPDILITLNDFFKTEYVKDIWRSMPWISYGAIDTDLITKPYSEMVKLGDEVVVPSLATQKALKEQWDLDAHYIPHGVLTDLYCPRKKEQITKERKEIGLEEDDFVIGFVGKNQFRKQPGLLFKLARDLRVKHKKDNIKLLFVTNMPGDFDLGYHVLEYGLEDGVKIIKDCGEEALIKYYNMMDIMVLPTMGEGFGIPLIEAMSCGVPVVTTEYTTGPEIVKEGGVLVPPIFCMQSPHHAVDMAMINYDKLLEAVEKFYTEPKYLFDMKAKARAEGLKWDWEKMIQGFDNLIKEVLDIEEAPAKK